MLNLHKNIYDASSEGIPIRYGAPESWKKVAARIGRTKPSRDGRKGKKKNDGRPPDTVKELVFSPQKKQAKLDHNLKIIASGPVSPPEALIHTSAIKAVSPNQFDIPSPLR